MFGGRQRRHFLFITHCVSSNFSPNSGFLAFWGLFWPLPGLFRPFPGLFLASSGLFRASSGLFRLFLASSGLFWPLFGLFLYSPKSPKLRGHQRRHFLFIKHCVSSSFSPTSGFLASSLPGLFWPLPGLFLACFWILPFLPWQNPGTRGLLCRSEGRPCQSAKNTHFGFWRGVPCRGVWGPRLAESRDPGPPAPVRRGRPRQCSRKVAKTNIFGSFEGLGGTPRGSGAPAWQIPGTRSLLGLSEGATPPSSQPPRPTCPVSCPETRKVVLCRLSSNPYRVREAKCLLGALTSRRAAGTGREDPQPDNNPFQLRFCCDTHILCRVRREAESEKAPLEGGWGGEP